jgi:hypothetical protein
MTTTRIVQLADGEELISYESGDQMRSVERDPRSELLQHRQTATYSRSINKLWTDRPSGPRSS